VIFGGTTPPPLSLVPIRTRAPCGWCGRVYSPTPEMLLMDNFQVHVLHSVDPIGGGYPSTGTGKVMMCSPSHLPVSSVPPRGNPVAHFGKKCYRVHVIVFMVFSTTLSSSLNRQTLFGWQRFDRCGRSFIATRRIQFYNINCIDEPKLLAGIVMRTYCHSTLLGTSTLGLIVPSVHDPGSAENFL
jgi:hypothetical protein